MVGMIGPNRLGSVPRGPNLLGLVQREPNSVRSMLNVLFPQLEVKQTVFILTGHLVGKYGVQVSATDYEVLPVGSNPSTGRSLLGKAITE